MQILPLSKAQQRIWLDAQLIPDSPAYNNPLMYRLSGNVNVELLQQALQSIVDSQPALRCYFTQQNGIPKQILLDKVDVNLNYYDVSNISINEKPQTIESIKENNVQKSFDISKLPLFRFTLIRCDQQEYLFILNIHHIVVDGYSASLLIQHISNFYNEQKVLQSNLNDIYINQLNKPATASKIFWLNELQDANFSIDVYAEQIHTHNDNGIREHFSITNDLTQRIKSFAREHKTTDFIVLMSAFFVTLAKYANQYDLTIGYAVDTRSSDCKNLFGFFVNNIPLRLQFSPQDDFSKILHTVTQKRKAIKSHQLYDYFDIICDVRQQVSSVTQLYSASFIRANFALTGLQLHDIEVTALPIYTGAVKDDISLLYDEDKNFEFEIEYRSEKYRPDLIQMIKQSYIQLLKSVTQNKNTPICELDIFTPHLTNNPILKNYKNDTLIARLKRYAITQGQHIAIRTKDEEISYQTLYEQIRLLSSQLASYQLDQQKPVIVLLDRKSSLLKTLLALQWLGLTYIPLDVNTPNERIKTIISESETSTVIVENDEPHYDCRVIKLNDLITSQVFIEPIEGELAYIIYTSGSTGKPKGVAIYSEALHHFLECMQQQLMLHKSDCLLAITTIAFDISALELFLPLWSGCSLYLANQHEYKDPFAITQLLDDVSINILQATPAMWGMLLAAGLKGKKTLTALCGGEALSSALAAELIENVYKLWNMYGPTEATIWCAVKEITDANKISIGHAIANMQFYILDEQQNILPAYVKGELCIAGIGLAKGYYQRDDLTKQQFIRHHQLQQRLYRTGDVACISENGEIILYGRKDNQVKLNGYRIELGEIEAHILHQAAVKQTAVIINKNQLIAYIVLNTNITSDEIHQELKNILPDYMLPAKYIFLESLPLSNSGKIDRKALAKQDISDDKPIILPYTALEKIIHTIWCDILQTKILSITDHFYAVGGHSLLATQIIAELQLSHQIAFSIVEFFRYPSIQSAAKFIEANQATIKLINKQHQNSYPLTRAQKRFWFSSQFIKDNNQFNMSGYLHIKGQINPEQLKQALHALMNQHVVLRCFIANEGDDTIQTINELACLPLDSTKAASFSVALSLLHAFANKTFSICNNLLWRALLIEINSNECLLGLSFHHIIMDGASIKILINDLWHAYAYENENFKFSLNKETISFFDYAKWESEQIISENKISFWLKLLNNTPYLRLPHDSNHSISNGEYIWENIHWSNIQNFCKQKSISPATYLIACFARLLQRITGLNEFCIGIPHAARNSAQTEYLVGCFIDLIPLKINMPDDMSFESWLLQLQDHVQTCTQHAIPFLNLLEQPSIARDDVQMPIFSVVLNIQPQVITQQNFSDFSFDLQYIANESSKYDLTLNLYFSDDGLNGQCEYDSNKFSANTIKSWCQDYQELLQKYLASPKLVLQRNTIDSVVNKETKASPDATNIALTPLHTELAACWQHFLNINHINLHDNFFTLGGHSLLATKIVATLNKKLNIAIPLETIFFKPIFNEFCNAVQNIVSHSQINSSSNFKNADIIPLTPNQQQLALLYSHQANDAYHLGVLIELPNALNISQLQTKIESVLSRHDVYMRHLSKNLQFTISASPKVELEVLTCNPLECKENLAKVLLQQPFNLYDSPLYRFAVIIENDKAYLAIVMHHLISDEWSLELFTNEILSTENQFSETQTNSFSSINFNNEDLQFWCDYLFDRLPSVLPSSKQIDPQTSMAKRLKYQLPAELLRECQSLSKEHGVSLYIIYLAIYLLHLKYFINEKTIFIATAYDRRNTQDRQHSHGYFVNLIPIIVDFSKIENLSDLIIYLNNDRNNSLQHADLDFASLLSNNITYTPHIIFNFQHNFKLQSDMQNLQWQEINATQAKFPLVFNLRNLESQMECIIEYNSDYYHEDYSNHCFSGFLNLLNYLPENKSKPISTWRLTNELSSTKVASNITVLLRNKLHQIFQQFSHKTALVFNDNKLTYADLWDKVQHLAQAIHDHRGEQTNQTIAVIMNNSDEYVITILAILTLGANFLPIDITLPIARQEQIISDAKATFVITNQAELSNYLQFHTLMNAECYDCFTATPESQLAYIIYTSGTTGKPKGVPITQQQLIQFISALANELSISHHDNILQFSSISFDASIWEIFLALLTGASLVIPNQKQRLVGSNLQNFMTTHEITHAILTPSVIKTLDADKATSLRSLVNGGEACTADLVTIWAEKIAFYNAYGPTEATVCTNLHRFNIKDKPTIIGKALGKNELAIISEHSQILPIGAIGELIIGGDSITSGYLQRPELNKEKFIYLNNHSEMKRYYRTGDLVRKLNHQEFEYIGRIDQQVKLRGLRIELGEIEAVIKEWGAQDALCRVKDNLLSAYVIDSTTIDTKVLLTHLAQTLPPYMVPQHILQIPDIPLTTSGKIDYRKLPDISHNHNEAIAPRNELEQAIYDIWCRFLSMDFINITQNFFELGGNSLQAMQIVANIEEHFNIEMSLSEFYSEASIEQQALFIAQNQKQNVYPFPTNLDDLTVEELELLHQELSQLK